MPSPFLSPSALRPQKDKQCNTGEGTPGKPFATGLPTGTGSFKWTPGPNTPPSDYFIQVRRPAGLCLARLTHRAGACSRVAKCGDGPLGEQQNTAGACLNEGFPALLVLQPLLNIGPSLPPLRLQLLEVVADSGSDPTYAAMGRSAGQYAVSCRRALPAASRPPRGRARHGGALPAYLRLCTVHLLTGPRGWAHFLLLIPPLSLPLPVCCFAPACRSSPSTPPPDG